MTRTKEPPRRVTRRTWRGYSAGVLLVLVLGATGPARSASDVVSGVQGGVRDQAPRSRSADVPRAVIPPPAGATVINFDGGLAPCAFAQTTAERNDFAGQGVTFTGPAANDGFAILDECGNFSVTGQSSPNFLAWNVSASLSDGGVARGPETLTFSPEVSLVQVNIGASGGGQATMEAFNSGGGSLGSNTIPLTSALQTLQVSANGIAKVVITVTSSDGVLDDLAFVQGPVVTDVPTLSEWAMIGMGVLLASLGLWAMGRRLVPGGMLPPGV